MEIIGDILSKKILRNKVNSRPVNKRYEEAREFSEYVGGLTIPFILRCFKVYGIKKVLATKSFLKDSNCPPRKKAGLLIWKLKQMSI